MSESNGKTPEKPPRPIGEETARLLERSALSKRIDREVSSQLEESINTLLGSYPQHAERVAIALEGFAADIRANLEAPRRLLREKLRGR